MRNKKLLLLMVLLILVVGSIAVEAKIGDRLKSIGGAAKGVLPIIVNTVILTVIIYFILHLIKFKMEGKKAPIIILAIVALLSFIIAKNVYGDQYIWFAKGFFSNIVKIIKDPASIGVFIGSSLLFVWLFNELKVGGEALGNKLNIIMAILIGYNLAARGASPATIVKAGEIIAIYILYNNLEKGGLPKYMSFSGAAFLVFYISSIAFEGKGWFYTIPSALLSVVVIALQVIMIIGFSKLEGFGINLSGLSDRIKKSRLTATFRYIIGGAIVYGIFCVLNMSKWFTKWFGMGLFVGKSWGILLLLVVGIIVLVVGVGYAKKKEEEEVKIGGILKDGWKYGVATVKDNIRMHDWIFNRIHIKDRSPDGEVPFIFRRLRAEISILMNYLLRLQVYLLKRNFSTLGKNIAARINKELKTTWSANRIKSDAYEYKQGFIAEQDKDSNWIFRTRKYPRVHEDGNITTSESNHFGWINNKYLIYILMNVLKKYLEDESYVKRENVQEDISLRKAIWDYKLSGRSIGDGVGALQRMSGQLQTPDIKTRCEIEDGILNQNYKSYMNLVEGYGKTQKRDSFGMQVLDMTRMYGWYKHSYRFARAWARAWMIPAKVVNGKVVEDKTRKRFRLNTPIGTAGEWPVEVGNTKPLHEIDERGRVLEDINTIEAGLKEKSRDFSIEDWRNDKRFNGGVEERKKKLMSKLETNGLYYRQIQFNERFDHTALHVLLEINDSEWDMFTRDFRFGEFHRDVRLYQEYEQCHRKTEHMIDGKKKFGYRWSYKGITPLVGHHGIPKSGYPAFDRQGLRDINFNYRGFSSIYDTSEGNLLRGVINNIPTITSQGLTFYIQDLFNELEGNMKLKEEHSRTYAWEEKPGKERMFATEFEIKEEAKKE